MWPAESIMQSMRPAMLCRFPTPGISKPRNSTTYCMTFSSKCILLSFHIKCSLLQITKTRNFYLFFSSYSILLIFQLRFSFLKKQMLPIITAHKTSLQSSIECKILKLVKEAKVNQRLKWIVFLKAKTFFS